MDLSLLLRETPVSRGFDPEATSINPAITRRDQWPKTATAYRHAIRLASERAVLYELLGKTDTIEIGNGLFSRFLPDEEIKPGDTTATQTIAFKDLNTEEHKVKHALLSKTGGVMGRQLASLLTKTT